MIFKKRKMQINVQRKEKSESGKYRVSGIYSKEELHTIIKYERARSDRENTQFSIITLSASDAVNGDRTQLKKFLSSVKNNIRDVDHLGWWDDQTFGVLLPSTDMKGAKICSEKLQNQLLSLGYDFVFSIYSYPDHWTTTDQFCKESENESACIDEEDRTLSYEKVFTFGIPAWKRALDVVGAASIILILSPLFLFVALYIKIVSPGKVFFVQKRVGYRGREFDFYKFRSMHEGNNQAFHGKHAAKFINNADTPMLKLDSQDPRIIPGGKLLRKLCIDELPQLFNVLKGDMSLAGPRPCIPYEREAYLRWHTHRFDTIPGMTGLWQVSGKNKLTFKQMIRLDIAYCRNLSPSLDLKILFLTIPAIIKMVVDSASKKMNKTEDDHEQDVNPAQANA